MTLTNTGANPLWNFSLALYALDGVAPACLQLQETAGIDVNLLLFCSWRAWQGIALEPADLAAVDAAVAVWRADVVHPIRALRQQLKDYPNAEASRSLIKRAELEAERVQQQCMYQQSLRPEADADAGVDEKGKVLEHNLQQFAAFHGIEMASLEGFCGLAKRGFRDL